MIRKILEKILVSSLAATSYNRTTIQRTTILSETAVILDDAQLLPSEDLLHEAVLNNQDDEGIIQSAMNTTSVNSTISEDSTTRRNKGRTTIEYVRQVAQEKEEELLVFLNNQDAGNGGILQYVMNMTSSRLFNLQNTITEQLMILIDPRLKYAGLQGYTKLEVETMIHREYLSTALVAMARFLVLVFLLLVLLVLQRCFLKQDLQRITTNGVSATVVTPTMLLPTMAATITPQEIRIRQQQQQQQNFRHNQQQYFRRAEQQRTSQPPTTTRSNSASVPQQQQQQQQQQHQPTLRRRRQHRETRERMQQQSLLSPSSTTDVNNDNTEILQNNPGVL